MGFDIDFVVTWVDGSDHSWIEKRQQYTASNNDESPVRFRDYGTFKYWFRAIEKYAPWVHKIYLITDHQSPDWLNECNPKLVLVDHKDYLPKEILPTFNSNAIELGIPDIEELTEHFVVFNDDMFLNAPVKPKDFFDSEGLPRDSAVQNAIMPIEDFDHVSVNNLLIINKHYNKRQVLINNFFKFFNPRYGYLNLISILLLPWPRFTRFYDPHIPISLLKSVCIQVLQENKGIKLKTMKSRFRSMTDNTIWLFRYEQLVSGKFHPRSVRIGKKYQIDQVDKVCSDITRSDHKMICINDVSLSEQDFQLACTKLLKAFQKVHPRSSSFEMTQQSIKK
ncbi:stealth family protein [Lapidilactobacillus gannanensis]|uniref:Stealth family protein n=1 Tax=Lapidilactobacillus gannanensis TaxID=2486002 RepID=A0ABW4BPA1_9LACO|nr:stealth family protein [Lapidilactobacillus gannanensis]